MGRLPKKTPISEEQALSRVMLTRSAAKKQAMDLLKGCLDSHLILNEKHSNIAVEVAKAIGYEENQGNQLFSSTNTPSSKTPNNHKRSFEHFQSSSQDPLNNDEHNEVCEVCDKGGDLICCETCSLVFHLKCLRPKISDVPEGKWSCPYCVVDGTVAGDKDVARKALRSMTHLANGELSEDEERNNADGFNSAAYRISKIGEISVLQSGKKYLVRKKGRKLSIELGRYSTLTEALSSIPSVQEVKSSRGGGGRKKHKGMSEIWCTKCNDDPSIELCAFCGCKVCFGKNHPNLLILCDNCNRETHAYCLHPPLNIVPDDDPWYCESCTEKIPKKTVESPSPMNDISAPGDEHDFDLLPLDTDSLSIGHALDDGGRYDKDSLSPTFHKSRRSTGSGRKSAKDPLFSASLSPDPSQMNSLSNDFSLIHSSKYHDHQVLSDESFVFHPSPLLHDIDVHDDLDHDDAESNDEEPPNVFLCSLDSAMTIINQLHEFKLTPNDLDALEELRTWGSSQDLHQAIIALSRQRDLLLNRLAMISPEVAIEFKKKCGIIESTLPTSSNPNQSQYHSSSNQSSVQMQHSNSSYSYHLPPQSSSYSHQQQHQQQYGVQQQGYYHPSTTSQSLIASQYQQSSTVPPPYYTQLHSQQAHGQPMLQQQQQLPPPQQLQHGIQQQHQNYSANSHPNYSSSTQHHQQMVSGNQYSLSSKPLYSNTGVFSQTQNYLSRDYQISGSNPSNYSSSLSNNVQSEILLQRKFNNSATAEVISSLHPNDQEFISGLFSPTQNNAPVSSSVTADSNTVTVTSNNLSKEQMPIGGSSYVQGVPSGTPQYSTQIIQESKQ